MHCNINISNWHTLASGTLTSEQKTTTTKPKTIAFRRSTEMQTAGVQKGRPEDVAWAQAFTQIVRYCAENNKQITVTDLCEKLKEYLNGDTPYTDKYLKLNLESPFGKDVILTVIRGKRNVVTSRSTAERFLERFLKSAKKKRRKKEKKKEKEKKVCVCVCGGGGGGGGAEGWSLQIAAKLLLVNINNTETSKEYASGAKVADLAANLDYIPPSVLDFFSCCFLFVVVAVAVEERTWSQNSFSWYLRLCCKQQGRRSSSHPFRLDFVLHCATWLVPDTALNTCIDRSFLHLTVRSNPFFNYLLHSVKEQSWPAAVQAAGLSSSATIWITRSKH